MKQVILKKFNFTLLSVVFFLMPTPLFSKINDLKTSKCYSLYKEKKYTEALSACTVESNNGYNAATYILGLLHIGNRQINSGMSLIKKSAHAGYPTAQTTLGLLYLNGTYVKKNISSSREWLMKATKKKFKPAFIFLGATYINSNSGKDYNLACDWFLKASKLNPNPRFIDIPERTGLLAYNLGYCYFKGTFVNRDYKKAVAWYQISAKQGNSLAQYRLAQCYEYGHGVPIDLKKALHWYEESYKNGQSAAKIKINILKHNILKVD